MTDPILQIGKSGLDTTEQKVKALTNKMVNAEVPGFKGNDVLIRSFPLELEAAHKRIESQQPQIEDTYYDYTSGTLMPTGNQLDLALGGKGFFVVLAPWGEAYTRDGRFTLDSEGRLISTANSYPLMGKNGPIIVTPGSKIEIDQYGNVMIGQTLVDSIRVVDIADKKQLDSVNGVLFKTASINSIITEVPSPRVVQGYVESSNTSIVDVMTELVQLSRLYNMDAKIISTRENIMSRAIEMGKVQ